MMLLTGCSAINPDFFKTVDDIATDNTIKIEVNKEAFQRETQSVDLSVSIKNKDK